MKEKQQYNIKEAIWRLIQAKQYAKTGSWLSVDGCINEAIELLRSDASWGKNK